MSTNDGGPAFPMPAETGVHAGHPGMSLRDWVAGQAMAAMVSDEAFRKDVEAAVVDDSTDCGRFINPKDAIAFNAYAYADAMLKAREQ